MDECLGLFLELQLEIVRISLHGTLNPKSRLKSETAQSLEFRYLGAE